MGKSGYAALPLCLNFLISSQITEHSAFLFKFSQHILYIIRQDWRVNIKIKKKFKRLAGDRAAFQFVYIDSLGVKLGKDAVKGSGLVFHGHHEARFLRPPVYFRLLGYADEPRVIVVGVLDIV
jgi:hypothetical protein